MARKIKTAAPAPAPKTPEQLEREAKFARARAWAETHKNAPLRVNLARVLEAKAKRERAECEPLIEKFRKDPARALEWSHEIWKHAARAELYEGMIQWFNLKPPIEPTLEKADGEGWSHSYAVKRNHEARELYLKELRWFETNQRIDLAKTTELVKVRALELAAEIHRSSSPTANLMNQERAKAMAELVTRWGSLGSMFECAARIEGDMIEGIENKEYVR